MKKLLWWWKQNVSSRRSAMENRIMSKISEFAAKHESQLEEVRQGLTSIGEAVKALDKQIADLNASPGAISPEDQAALDRIQAASENLVRLTKDVRTDAETNPPVEG